MKTRLIAAAALIAAALVTSCSPETYSVYLDVRKPSTSGFDLAGKSIGIVYVDGGDSSFTASTATALAKELEGDYFGSREMIGLYTVPPQDSVTISTMRDLVMDTGEDVVFLMSSSMGDTAVNGTVPYSMNLYVYDSMGEDALSGYSGTANLVKFDQGVAEEMAKRASKRFKPTWKTESFTFYWYYDDYYKWSEALDKISEGKFLEAIKVWEGFVKSRNSQKASCASYNIAMGFYLLGDMDLATRWLDLAEKQENVSLAPALRKRIAANLEK